MTFLWNFLLFSTVCCAVSSALNCTECVGNGTTCRDQGRIMTCPSGDGLCGRVWFRQNGVPKVVERCALKEQCVGTIDCLKDGFELGKRFKNATNCVTSCCDGENCDPKEPLKCYQCKGKGEKCESNSVSCGYKEDRCLRIQTVDKDGKMMTDQRCSQASRCSNATEICAADYPSAKECMAACCDKPNCVAEFEPKNSNAIPIASCILIGFLTLLGELLKP